MRLHKILPVLFLAIQPLPSFGKDSDEKYEVYFKPPENTYSPDKAQIRFVWEKGEEGFEVSGIRIHEQSIFLTSKGADLKVEWDSTIIDDGSFQLISKSGEVLSDISSIKRNLGVILPLDKMAEDNFIKGCITKQSEKKEILQLCSSWYGIKKSKVLIASQKLENPILLLNNTEVLLKKQHSKPVGFDEQISFFSRTRSGLSLQFVSTFKPPTLFDLVKENGKVQLRGEGFAPVHPSTNITVSEQYSGWESSLGFQKTIGEAPDVWKVELTGKEDTLIVPGTWGGFFEVPLKFDLTKIPESKDRFLTKQRLPITTYSEKGPITLISADSKETSLETNFPPKFKEDFVEIPLKTESKEFTGLIKAYRGSNKEISTRLSVLTATTGESVPVGELAFSWWFEDFASFNSYYLTKQRWSFHGKYFQSSAPVLVDNEDEFKINSLELQLRYRFTPGVWERDEAVGVIFAQESLTSDLASLNKLGGGLYWARSMPRVFDSLLNYIPFMNYPKWVDMDLVLFPTSMDPQYQLKSNFELNFHGKIKWTPALFGEAGFGIKNYSFKSADNELDVDFYSFYGTAGLGLSF